MKSAEWVLLACFVATLIGSMMMLWIYVRLERAGVKVKWFGTMFDQSRAFQQYSDLAQQGRWRKWPLHVIRLMAFGGLIGMLITILVDRSILGDLVRWLAR
jgi:hypothetical protein